MKIGDSIWFFDANRRHYKRENGISTLIWREHWVERFVVGETSRSWLIGLTRSTSPNSHTVMKLSKADVRAGKLPGWALDVEKIDREEWLVTHRHRISEAVRRATYEQLQEVAKVIGYNEKSGGQ